MVSFSSYGFDQNDFELVMIRMRNVGSTASSAVNLGSTSMELFLAVLIIGTPQVALFMMAQQLPTVTIMVGTRHQEDLHTITTAQAIRHTE